MSAYVPLPDLTFRDGVPFAQGFDDVYFSKAGGVAETNHVFIEGNTLPQRFAAKKSFTIGETGFGTALNFLVAWQRFLQTAPANHQLHYISLEKFPLNHDMLREALVAHPELRALAKQLVAAYPLRLPGFHRMHFPRVTLTLGFGDAAVLLTQIDASVDAWFLDGFAPAKNPDLWSDAVFAEIGRLSAPDATFATFTSAGLVRRGLAVHDFNVEKTIGYGRKREMSVGSRAGTGNSKNTAPHDVLVIGGGIAGCSLARSLAGRGCKVTLLERREIADGASGNPAAVLFPQLSKNWNRSTAWYFTAYGFMVQQLARWKIEGLAFTAEEIGMLRLPRHAEEEAQLRALNASWGLDPSIAHWVERDAASQLAGLPLTTGATYFPRGTWLSPAKLCRALVAHPNISVQTKAEVTTLVPIHGKWQAKIASGDVFTAEKCCIAAASQSAAFFAAQHLKIALVSGQISEIAAGDVAAKLSTILCHKGYIIPQGDRYLLGATYDHHDFSREVTAKNHQQNLAEVESFLPGWINATPLSGRTSIRATTPDRMPYIGAVAENLWVSTGHGSRGFLSAPLAAEMIASEICGEMVPVTRELRAAVNPLRFATP